MVWVDSIHQYRRQKTTLEYCSIATSLCKEHFVSILCAMYTEEVVVIPSLRKLGDDDEDSP